MLELVEQGVLSIETVVDRMCHAPAKLFGIDRRGYLKAGYYADVAVVKHTDAAHTITDDDVLSLCGWTPLTGASVHHEVVLTYVNGHRAYDHGEISNEINGRPLKFIRK